MENRGSNLQAQTPTTRYHTEVFVMEIGEDLEKVLPHPQSQNDPLSPLKVVRRDTS